MSCIPSLKNLCIYESLGTEYLRQSLPVFRYSQNPAKCFRPFSHFHTPDPKSRLLNEDLISEIMAIITKSKKFMTSQRVFLETIKKDPWLALVLIKKYPISLSRKINLISRLGQTTLHFAALSGSRPLVQYLIQKKHLEKKCSR